MQGSAPKKTRGVRADGRRQFLVYLPPALIKAVKKVAVDDDTTASAIVEEALRKWVEHRPDELSDEQTIA